MSKASIFVVSCSVSIVILFCLFCYLMHTVNPEPFVNATRRVSDIPKEELVYINDQLSSKDDLHYGMEKLPENYFTEGSDYTETTWDDSYRKSHPVEIPIVRYTGPLVQSTTTKTFEDQKPITILVYPKDVRRSIEPNNSTKTKQGESKNVLLKIVDDSGKARMEVIVDSGQIHYKDQSISNLNKTKELNVYEVNPNNTLLYNVVEQSLKIVANDVPKHKSTV